MDLVSQVALLGGICDRRTLVRLRSRTEVDRALRDGALVRDTRGRYALPNTSPALRIANRVLGVLSHRSAAQYWGWAQKRPDGLPEVTVPRSRRVDPGLRRILIPHWADLPNDDVHRSVTTQRRTLIDCMRNLPWDEALAIVDSALRADDIDRETLLELASSTRGRGRTRIMAVAAAATAAAANIFESVLRAQALLVPGLDVKAQHPIRISETQVVHPDLADPALGLALEAEGFGWHGKSAALTRDCRRYNSFTLQGWHVIRFSWRLVMYEPAYVQQVLREAVAIARAGPVRRAATAPRHANFA
jgi:very-short-patch-repair endonuclease